MPSSIWNREFNPNSALKSWSINSNGNLGAPSLLRFEMRPGDQFNNDSDILNNRERTEISGVRSPFEFDQNYQFTTSFNLTGYTGGSTWLKLMQILEVRNGVYNPVFGLQVRDNGQWQVVSRNDTNPNADIELHRSSSILTQGVTHSLSVTMRVGKAGPSALKVRLDGVQWIDLDNAPMGFQTGLNPYFKLGIYRPASNDTCVIKHIIPKLTLV